MQKAGQKAEHKAGQKAEIRRKIRRRALQDAAFVILVAVVVSQPVASAHDSLLVGIAAVAIGILFFMVRRSRDLQLFVQAARRDARRLSGGGISLQEWHGGAPLRPWSERRQDGGNTQQNAA